MALVVNRGPNALCLRVGEVEVDLEVGATEVDDAKLEVILAGGPAGALFDKQCECVVDTERAPDEGTKDFKGGRIPDLSKLKLKAALDAIAACTEPEQLKAWVFTDARPQVKKALHLRDRELRPADEVEDIKLSKVL